MNTTGYVNAKEIGYYKYPPDYYQRNMISITGRIKKANNHRVVNGKLQEMILINTKNMKNIKIM